jgi:hypothetical protein
LGRSFRIAAATLLPVMLAACAAGDEGRSITYTDDRGVSAQPFPANYRTEVLAFLRTYLNNPVGVRDAAMAEPVERVVGGRQRYVVCVRFSARESDGGYREPRTRGILFWPPRPRHRKCGRTLCGPGLRPFPRTRKDDPLAQGARPAPPPGLRARRARP